MYYFNRFFKNYIKPFLKKIKRILSERTLILLVSVCVLFYILYINLFNLQIVNGKDYVPPVKETSTKMVPIEAPRGEIFDRYGRPLAVNIAMYSIRIDPSIYIENLAEAMGEFVDLMERYGEELTLPSTFPISTAEPYEFLFNGSAAREERWKLDMDIDIEKEIDAAAAYELLIKRFKIPDDLPEEKQRLLLELCSEIYMRRYNLTPLTVASNIKAETVAAVTERIAEIPNLYIDEDYMRSYPSGEYTAHIIGYIRGISPEEYEANKDLGYKMTDLFGKSGIELSFESTLKGERGERAVEIDARGRRLNSEITKEPEAGNDVFLTLDLELQMVLVDALERQLSEILVNKLLGKSSREKPVTPAELLTSMISANNISVAKIMSAEPGTISAVIKNYVETYGNLDGGSDSYNEQLKNFINDAVNTGKLTTNQIIGAMVEQGIISATDEEMAKITANTLPPVAFLVEKVQSGEITPQMANIVPMSASAVVVDVSDGSVLAAANYPNYDNNKYINFDYDYYMKINFQDPTNPLINRAFSSPRAPGSTFKMITALAGLHYGVITPNTIIYDEGTYTKAGVPHARCWIGAGLGSHGSINVSGALEMSCNFFFYETAYRLGNSKESTWMEGIEKLNAYMSKFGLDSPTGVEISETSRMMSSPAYKEASAKFNASLLGEVISPSKYAWTGGDTIRTAIGQFLNSYSAAKMAKYIATLANGGTRYQLHLLDKITSSSGAVLQDFTAVVEEVIDIAPENLRAVYEGMRLVLYGRNGTASTFFNDIPITLAGKTGTADQTDGGIADVSFACFAPFDDPQIAIYVVIPNGNTPSTIFPAEKIAKEVLNHYFKFGETAEDIVVTNGLTQ